MSAWNCISRSFTAAPPSTRRACERRACFAVHRFEHVGHLERDGFKRRARNVSRPGVAAQADQHARRVRVPVRRAEAHKRRHKHHAARVRHARRKRFHIGRGADELQIVAQPLHHRAANKDAAFEARTRAASARSPRPS